MRLRRWIQRAWEKKVGCPVSGGSGHLRIEMTMTYAETNTCEINTATDEQLVAEFARTKAEAAFRELVERHAGWVYAVAFRMLQDGEGAEDATQAVFILLYQRARKLAGHAKIAGWLFTTVNFTARAMMRARRRREYYERKAAAEQNGVALPPAITGELDGALKRIGAEDREAILLRFYRGLEYAQVAEGLGISADAARKRVDRALVKLRRILGDGASAEGVASAVLVGMPAAKATLHAKVAGTALAVGNGAAAAGGTSAAVKGTVILMAMAKVKVAVGTVVVGLALAAVVVTTRTVLKNIVGNTEGAGAPAPGETELLKERGTAFDEVYGLKDGEVVKIVPPPFIAERLEMARQSNAAMMRYQPNGPTAMFVSWKGWQPKVTGSVWGGGGWSLRTLVTQVMQVSAYECEGTLWPQLKMSGVKGDIVVRADATEEQRMRALEKALGDALGVKVQVDYREVERPVIVLSGSWSKLEAGGRGALIDIYGQDEETNNRNIINGNAEGFTESLADWLDKQVILEAGEAPMPLNWRTHATGNGGLWSRLMAHNAELVLQHVQEETGLKAVEETRKVRRLFVEEVK